MQSNRSFTPKKLSRMIINKSFAIFNALNVGDEGQLILNGTIEGERLDEIDDGTELFLKKIYITKLEKIRSKNER